MSTKKSISDIVKESLPQVNPEVPKQNPFAGKHVHFCIPCYGGQIMEPCFTSFLRFILMAQQVGLQWSLDTMVNESLIPRGRNNLVSKMLFNKASTHLMFIDADIRFQPESIFWLLQADKDVIAGLYPMKKIPTQYVVNGVPGALCEGPLEEVATIGTGFMMVKRKALEDMIEKYPQTKYVDDIGIGKQFEPHMYALFDGMIDENGHYLSEDWTFCKRWRDMGGKVWAHKAILLNHAGFYEFKGDTSLLGVTTENGQPPGNA
jgi:hypothetical protein